MIYKIKRGTHKNWFSIRWPFMFRRFRVDFKLNETMWYPGGGTGWNKLVGVTSLLIHKNSYRIAWRPAEESGMFKLAIYEYINKERVITPFRGLFKANELVSVMIDKQMYILTGFYFGGQDKAPHDMQVEINFEKL